MESGTFQDFMQQVPLELIRLFFLFIVLFVMTIAGYILVKRYQKRQKTKSVPSVPSETPPIASQGLPPTNNVAVANTNGSGDGMPDLDTLLAMTEPTAAASPPPSSPNGSPPNRQPGIINVQLTSGEQVEAVEMMILSRDRATQNLVVQIGDHAYTGAESDIDMAFKRQFASLIKELSGIAPALGRAAKPSSGSQTSPKKPTGMMTGTQPKKPTKQQAQPEIAQPMTLAAQLEQHLQLKLQTTGAFLGRSIHVMDAADGGVTIEVDGAKFNGVGDVADPAVKNLLKEVVAEWQASQ
jgi:hypothetical protein